MCGEKKDKYDDEEIYFEMFMVYFVSLYSNFEFNYHLIDKVNEE
jgi:hypothetical protein